MNQLQALSPPCIARSPNRFCWAACRDRFIVNGTLAAALGLSLRLWRAGLLLWFIGHMAAVWAAKRDPAFVEVVQLLRLLQERLQLLLTRLTLLHPEAIKAFVVPKPSTTPSEERAEDIKVVRTQQACKARNAAVYRIHRRDADDDYRQDHAACAETAGTRPDGKDGR